MINDDSADGCVNDGVNVDDVGADVDVDGRDVASYADLMMSDNSEDYVYVNVDADGGYVASGELEQQDQNEVVLSEAGVGAANYLDGSKHDYYVIDSCCYCYSECYDDNVDVVAVAVGLAQADIFAVIAAAAC